MTPQSPDTPPTPAPRLIGMAIGAACVIAGGLVAAVSSPLHLEKGSWAAAYLVLVAGVAQIVLSQQQRLLRPAARRPRGEWAILVLWTAGNAAVITGSLLRSPLIVDAGGLALMAALALALVRTRGSRAPLLGWALRVLYVIVLVSIPIGLFLAHVRA